MRKSHNSKFNFSLTFFRKFCCIPSEGSCKLKLDGIGCCKATTSCEIPLCTLPKKKRSEGLKKAQYFPPLCSFLVKSKVNLAKVNLVINSSSSILYYYIYMAFQLYCRRVQYWAILHSSFGLCWKFMKCLVCNNNNIEWP